MKDENATCLVLEKKTKEYFERVTETSRIKRTYVGGLCCLPEKPGYWDQRAKS